MVGVSYLRQGNTSRHIDRLSPSDGNAARFQIAAAECPRPSQPPVYRTVQFRGGCNLRTCDV